MSQITVAFTLNELIDKVKDALSDVTRRSDIAQLPPNASLIDDVGLDSMSVLAFFMALEEKIDGFRIEVDSVESSDLQTIASVAGFVHSRLS